MSALAKTAIVGVGATEQGQIPGQSGNQIAVRAAVAVLADAGIDKSEIDGLVTCKPPRSAENAGIDENIGQRLGINPAFASTLEYGACAFSMHLAAAAISAGLCRTVLLTYGTNQRSAKTSFAVPVGGTQDWASLAGLVHVAAPAAMAPGRQSPLYGTTAEQLGWVWVPERDWAQDTPLPIFRKPVSTE